MVALQDALNDLATGNGDLDAMVKVARDALIAANANKDGLNADAECRDLDRVSGAHQQGQHAARVRPEGRSARAQVRARD